MHGNKVSIAAVRSAAFELKAKGKAVTYSAISRMLHISLNKVIRLVNLTDDLPEICARSRRFYCLEYALAADNIKQRGQIVTTQSLAKEMGLTRSGVAMALNRHPTRKKVLEHVTQWERKRQLRIEKYKAVVDQLRMDGNGSVNKSVIAGLAGVSSATFLRDLRADPSIEKLLGMSKRRESEQSIDAFDPSI